MCAWDVWILEGLWFVWSFCFPGSNSFASPVALQVLVGTCSCHSMEISLLQNIWGEALKGLCVLQAGRWCSCSVCLPAGSVGRSDMGNLESPRLWEQRQVCEASVTKCSRDENVMPCEETLLRPLSVPDS